MRVLWITNTIFPAPSKALGLSVPVVGGWMYGLAAQLAANREVHLAVATVYQGNELKILNLDDIRYYLLPCRVSSSYQKHLQPRLVGTSRLLTISFNSSNTDSGRRSQIVFIEGLSVGGLFVGTLCLN